MTQVAMTPVANFDTGTAGVVDTVCHWHRWQIADGINDTGSKFAAGINDIGGKYLMEKYQTVDILKWTWRKKIN